MSTYEGLTSLGLINEKHTTVVFDFGYSYTKLGFAGEPSPRAIVKSDIKCRRSGKFVPVFEAKDEEQLIQQLVDFIHILYFKKLLVNAKDRRVIIVENVLGSSLRKNALASVFFKYYEVLSLLFVPSHLVSLMTLSINTAIVMDIGYEEATVIPIYEGVPILNAWQSTPCAGRTLHNSLSNLLLDRGLCVDGKGKEERLLSSKINKNILEDIKVRCCLASTLERGRKLQKNKYDRSVEPPPPPPEVRYPLQGDSFLKVPGIVREMASEVLFEMDQDSTSLASIILHSVMQCPIDTRRTLANNLFIIGGTACLRGLKSRLLLEIKHLAKDPLFSQTSKIESFKIHHSPTKDNCVAWLGGAIIGCTEVALLRSLSRDTYLELGIFPDWSNLLFNIKDDDATRMVG